MKDFFVIICEFFSNAGGHEIAKKTLEYYEEGRPREEIKFKEMEEITIKSAYNEGMRI